jgi:8-oxo-dGTP pyrophosphatase MutT (NUDIX family)
MEWTAEWLRTRCMNLHPVSEVQELPQAGEVTAAAVLIPVVDRPAGLTVLLTQRTAHLREHAGQISFPGGRCEPTDKDRVDTALRESREEVGILPEQVSVLTVLPEYWTSTGFRVTPVLGLVTPPLNLQLDDFEVAEVFEPPLAFFLDAANYRRESREHQGQQRHYWAVPWRDYYVWGATAGMFVSLRQSLFGPDQS